MRLGVLSSPLRCERHRDALFYLWDRALCGSPLNLGPQARIITDEFNRLPSLARSLIVIHRRDALKFFAASATGFAVPTILGCDTTIHNPMQRASLGQAASSVAEVAAAPLALIKQLTIRRSQERGHADHGWLKTNHSFSFARYRDPAHMGFRALRVINEDVIQGSGGFPMHPHEDMEILTYILDGALEHKDSMGNGSVIKPGEVQAMSAGTGVRHSEFNPSALSSVHLLQIWLLPNKRGHAPRYQQKPIARHSAQDPIQLIASPDGAQGSVAMHQDVYIHACKLDAHQQLSFEVKPSRHAWIQVAQGDMTLNGHTLHAGDGVSTSDDGWLLFEPTAKSELLIFDLA